MPKKPYKKIIVTGGTSVPGKALRDIVAAGEFSDRDFLFISSKDCNLLDLKAIQAFVAKTRPDAIIHFAAAAANVKGNTEHPASVMRDNIYMNFNIAEAARLAPDMPKLLMTLSAAMYSSDAPLPVKEESIHLGALHESIYGYGFAKRLIEPMIRAYRKEYGLVMIGIIPGAIVGPSSNFSAEGATFVPGLIRRFYEHREGNEPLVVWGDGTPLRQITAAEDIGRICMWCIDNYDGELPLNVSTAEEVTIKDAALMVAEALHVNSKRIVFDMSKPNGTHRQTSDNGKFIKLSGFTYVPTREVIKKTVDYFVASYPDSRKLRL